MCKEIEFDDLARIVHKERLEAERKESQSLNRVVEIKFALFKIWCKAFDENAENFETFIKYSQTENVKIKPLIRKHIAERYFSKNFIFNYKTGKWEAVA